MPGGGGGGDSSQEKTEDATPKRLREARKKGQVFKSQDMEGFMVLLAAFSSLALSFTFISDEISGLMNTIFTAIAKPEISIEETFHLGKIAFFTVIKCCAPVMITVFLVAGIVGFLQVGPVFSIDPLMPDPNKLNAIENLKNMFKPKIFFELAKNIFKIVVIFYLAYRLIKGMLDAFLLTVTAPVLGSAQLGGMVISKFLIQFFILFFLLSILDFMFQRKEYLKNLKMSKDEVKREYKEDEGDPLIKGHRRQLHMEMAMSDTRSNVKNADAVVTNPTHIAVAVKYNKKDMNAPEIVAKGQRLYAEFIKDLAKEYNIPIVRNIPLAWSLIELEIGDEIPEKLYLAVAEILTFVYRMKEEQEKS